MAEVTTLAEAQEQRQQTLASMLVAKRAMSYSTGNNSKQMATLKDLKDDLKHWEKIIKSYSGGNDITVRAITPSDG